MTWSFRKRVKIIPGVYLNLSKSGVCTSIGVKGTSTTFGKSGAYFNSSVLSLGIYNRQKLKLSGSGPRPPIQSDDQNQASVNVDNIFSADIHEITSQNMQGVKETVQLARQQRQELNDYLLKIKRSLSASKTKRILSYLLLYGFVKRTIPKRFSLDIHVQKEAIKQTIEEIDKCYVSLNIAFDPDIREKYNKLIRAFVRLNTCDKIWDVTSAHHQDGVKTGSSASTIVNKKEVLFTFKSLPDIKSEFTALYFQKANGADLYFYPSFVAMYAGEERFALIGFDEIALQHRYVRFTETGRVPSDAKIIDQTWAKVNKSGTPDKRFKGNYQIPVVCYGEISLKTATGLNEQYEFSNYECAKEFSEAFNDYKAAIGQLK